jgi:hypothetical protein
MPGAGGSPTVSASSGAEQPLMIDLLNVEDVQLSLSFKTDPGSRPPGGTALIALGLDFANLTNLPLKLPGMELEHIKVG